MTPIKRFPLLFVLFLSCYALNAQTTKPRRILLKDPNITSSLVLDLSISKASYSLEDDLDLTALLRNEGTVERIFISDQLGWGSGSGLVLRIEDMSGQEIKSLIDNLPAPPLPDDPAPLVGLRLGQAFGIRLKDAARNFFPSPGQYKLRVSYGSVLRRDLVDSGLQNLNILWAGHEPIASPWVVVKITP